VRHRKGHSGLKVRRRADPEIMGRRRDLGDGDACFPFALPSCPSKEDAKARGRKRLRHGWMRT
jgi:hypothetical protein